MLSLADFSRKSLPSTVVGVGALKPAVVMRDEETVTELDWTGWRFLRISRARHQHRGGPAVAISTDLLGEKLFEFARINSPAASCCSCRKSPQAALARPVFGRLYTRYDTIEPKAVAIFARIAKVGCVRRSTKLLSLNR